MHSPRFEPFSVWADKPSECQPQLKSTIRTDVAIIGGGYTGLSAALTFRQEGREVVLIEAGFCGSGSSGRNAGYMSPTVGGGIIMCINNFGAEKGIALQKFSEDAVEYSEGLIRDLNIECDYERLGNFIAGVHESHLEGQMKNARAAIEAGLQMSFVGESELRQMGVPKGFLFGIKEHVGGMLNPAKFVFGLRQAVLKSGAQVYEGTKVQKIHLDNKPIEILTESGKVVANQVFLATNAYTVQELGLLRSKLIPMRVHQFCTQPLDDEQLKRLKWQSRLPIVTSHGSLENFRLSPDNRIIGGSKWIQYSFGSKLAEGDRPKLFEKFDRLLAVRFPEVPRLKIEKFWGGWTCMTRDYIPIVGTLGSEKNVHYSVGYNGHGMAHGNYLGHLSALHMSGKEAPGRELFDRRLMPLPPEPLRWLGVQFIYNSMLWPDKSVDKILETRAAALV